MLPDWRRATPRLLLGAILCLACPAICTESPVRAAEPAERTLDEKWASIFVDGLKAGFSHLTVQEINLDGRKSIRRTEDFRLKLRQVNNQLELRMESGTEELPTGEVTAVFMRQYSGKEVKLDLQGTVRGDELHVKVRGYTSLDRRLPWDKKAIGHHQEMRLFEDRKLQPKDRFSYSRFEPTVNALLTVRVTAHALESVDVLGAKMSLLRVEAVPEKIQGVQLPATTYWLDKELQPRRWAKEMPGIGTLVFLPTSAEEAQKFGTDAPDIHQRRLIRINRRIERPQETAAAVYRITRKKTSDEDLSTLFAVDVRQSYARVQNDIFELRVKKVGMPEPSGKSEKPAAEYLADCQYIKWDDANVRKHAQSAVGAEADPWKRALLIKGWVHKNMEMTWSDGEFAPADRVARTLKGNVSEYAFLAAAMARAAGIPSRTAIGLVYDEVEGKPVMRYHMWTEVWIQSEWQPIDPTLGTSGIGACHVKIADHSWKDVRSLTPLIPVARVWGAIEIEVMDVKRNEAKP